MAQYDLKISDEIKNKILGEAYTIGGGNTNLYFTLNHDTGQNRLGKFNFSGGVATLNASIHFDVIVNNDPIVINKIYLGKSANNYDNVATINLVGDEIKTFNESGALSIMTLTIELKEVNS